jgi:eukaryotic-like serine/threonine-protein kinase
MGTPAYMSPEQVRSKDLDARTDLFSFGAVLYQMATGKVPFEGENWGVICSEILTKNPQPPRELNPLLSHGLEDIIARTLEKDRELRYQHAADLRSDLMRLKRDSDIVVQLPAPRPSPAPKRSWGWIGAAACLLIFGAAAGAFVAVCTGFVSLAISVGCSDCCLTHTSLSKPAPATVSATVQQDYAGQNRVVNL